MKDFNYDSYMRNNPLLKEADEPGSPERLLLSVKNQAIALYNAAKKTLDNSEQPPYFDKAKGDYASQEIDNVADNLVTLMNMCNLFVPESSNNLQSIRSNKLAIARRADQKMGTPPPPPPRKPVVIPGVTGKTNLGKSSSGSTPPKNSPPPPLPTKKSSSTPPRNSAPPPLPTKK